MQGWHACMLYFTDAVYSHSLQSFFLLMGRVLPWRLNVSSGQWRCVYACLLLVPAAELKSTAVWRC